MMKNMKIKSTFAMSLIALSISNVYALENTAASAKPVTER